MYEEYVCLAFFLRFSPPAFLGALADFFDGVLAIVDVRYLPEGRAVWLQYWLNSELHRRVFPVYISYPLPNP